MNSFDKKGIIGFINSKIGIEIATIQNELKSLDESLKNETKSSAGDKFETGREMINQEISKLQAALSNKNKLLADLDQLKLENTTPKAVLGSIVVFDNLICFISVPYGKLDIGTENIFCISPGSPLAQKMIGSTAGDTIEMNGQNFIIKSVI